MSEMSDPIHNPPSYYLLPDGTEIREMIRQARGDESTIEHLAQSIMEYASRLGKKPGASRADDFRKIARCAIQGVNVCEGRSVSDNGDPPPEPDQHALATAISRAIEILTFARDIQAAVNVLTDAVGSESTPAPAPPPEPELDQHEDGVYLPNSRKACHARIRRLDRELTEASEHLQKVVGHGVGILCVADAAKAIVEPLLRPHVTLPVVSTGEPIPCMGSYVWPSSDGANYTVIHGAKGFITPSTLFGPIPPACGWPTKPEGELETEEA